MEIELRARIVAETGHSTAWAASLRDEDAPRVVLTTVSGAPDHTLSDGRSGLEDARVQIDCYGTSYGEARGVASAVDAALDGWSGSEVIACWRESTRDLQPGADEYLFRVSMDFRVQFKRA